MPIIEGGTYRVWSRTQDLQLSAEQSYDPNMDPDNQSLLHYHWECQSTSKVMNLATCFHSLHCTLIYIQALFRSVDCFVAVSV